jgi:hypothetical protein
MNAFRSERKIWPHYSDCNIPKTDHAQFITIIKKTKFAVLSILLPFRDSMEFQSSEGQGLLAASEGRSVKH